MRRGRLLRATGGFVGAILTAAVASESHGAERYDADLAASRVTIEGTSTLHDWHVEGHHVGGYVTVEEPELAAFWGSPDLPSPPFVPTVRVEIPVTSLTSGKRGMDEKMYEALKAKAYPMITYRLESAKVTTRQTAQGDEADGRLAVETTGILTAAGVERTVDLPMRVRRLSDHRLEISGDTALRMTEFGIDPPRAMLGTLRTGTTVHVHWTWVLAQGGIGNRHGQ
ncbi:MAG: YceI family protein [Candidatus Omnitrophica bacterium]|nr:YceI family protein [Candidatus Omnitrophota bacterium]